MSFFLPQTDYKSAYEIPYEELFRKGIRGIVFDIDNTLVLPDAPADQRSEELFQRIRGCGMKTCLVSNNGEQRVRSFAEEVDSPYVFKAWKPGKRGFLKAMEQMGTDARSTASVGDQLFTDMVGSNRCGLFSILVKPMTGKEEIQIRLKRILEIPFLFFYDHSRGKK